MEHVVINPVLFDEEQATALRTWISNHSVSWLSRECGGTRKTWTSYIEEFVLIDERDVNRKFVNYQDVFMSMKLGVYAAAVRLYNDEMNSGVDIEAVAGEKLTEWRKQAAKKLSQNNVVRTIEKKQAAESETQSDLAAALSETTITGDEKAELINAVKAEPMADEKKSRKRYPKTEVVQKKTEPAGISDEEILSLWENDEDKDTAIRQIQSKGVDDIERLLGVIPMSDHMELLTAFDSTIEL